MFQFRTAAFIACLLSLFYSASAQKTEKIYLSEEWKKTTADKATYFRLVTLDANGKPVGKVKDYFMTGELKWEGQYQQYDLNDASKCIETGICTWYYKNGEKEAEVNYVNGKMQGIFKYWTSWGALQREIGYDQDVYDGPYNIYDPLIKKMVLVSYQYKKGKLHGRQKVYLKTIEKYLVVDYENGQPKGYWHQVCTYNNKCQKAFIEDFRDPSNPNKWTLPELPQGSVEMNKGGLLLKAKEKRGLVSWSGVSFDHENEFTVSTKFRILSGDAGTGQGIIWNFRDGRNYSYATLHNNGKFRLGRVEDGKEFFGEKEVEIKKDESNLLQMSRIKSVLTFFINGKEILPFIHIRDQYGDKLYDSGLFTFKGRVGIFVHEGKGEVKFEHLEIYTD